ncbi:hypothetical protein [Microbulbifer guangxiensis]|uniref:hypothetical protein n=1 Tax=Microbulbifer guangxiensis TaxID=2904249 RepID=UPI001F3F754E|nr:hypothetical protein [Microbulbifer guangxiensis]
MPYRHARYWVSFVLIVILVGFWDSYFTTLKTVPLAFHAHAITALAWVFLLLLQDWSIRSRRRNLHRIGGTLSLFLFPFLIVGFVMIINMTAANYAANENEIFRFLGPSFALSMLIAITAYLTLFYLALKHRRNTRLHAGYMLSTPLVLFESPFSRVIMGMMPFLIITGSEIPQRILDAIATAMMISAVFGLLMYLRDRKGGVPFLLAAIFLVIETICIYMGTHIQWVRQGLEYYAQIPAELTVASAFLLGTAVSWLGWNAAKGPKVQGTAVLPS